MAADKKFVEQQLKKEITKAYFENVATWFRAMEKESTRASWHNMLETSRLCREACLMLEERLEMLIAEFEHQHKQPGAD